MPKVGSCRNGRNSARKSARRIPKGVIPVQASFNNTIVTVTDVRGRVISWSSAGTCGFKGTRRGNPFAAQTTTEDSIQVVIDQEKVKVSTSTRTRQWKCVESRTDSKCLYYGRFILSPLMKGQVDTIGTAMRRALLRELEGTCITFAKSEKIPHEYSTIVEIVLRGNFFGTRNAFICAKGPGYVTAQDIILPPSMETVDNTQHVANLTKPIDLCIGLQIERNRGYDTKMPKNFHDRSYPIDVVFMPIRNVNHSIHCYGNDNEKQEILFLEIWTNGSLTPKEALHEASRNLIG
ncbi:hypothetical protein GOBAR_DD11054 [Gossypium barbadense]|nr:hypothetical protein GOBAR_DD11054 [Gossypium barbadense]